MQWSMLYGGNGGPSQLDEGYTQAKSKNNSRARARQIWDPTRKLLFCTTKVEIISPSVSIDNLQMYSKRVFTVHENMKDRNWASNIYIFFLQELSIKTEGDVLIVLAKHETKAEGTWDIFFINCKHAKHKGNCCCDQAFFEWNIQSSRRSELRLQAVRAEVLLALRGQAREDILIS